MVYVSAAKVFFLVGLYTLHCVYGSAGTRAGVQDRDLCSTVDWTLGLQMSVWQDISVRGMGCMAVDTHEEET